MARAMIDGMTSPVTEAALKSNGDKFVITVADRHESKLMPIKSKCAVTLDAEEAVGVSDHVIVAIKPQGAEEVAVSKTVGCVFESRRPCQISHRRWEFFVWALDPT